MKTLLINAHRPYPGISGGSLNAAAQDVARRFFTERGEVTETVIEAGYDPAEEERKHRDADLVILQTPINWFSPPWTWKKYIDEVFTYALAQQYLVTGDGRSRKDPNAQYGSGGRMQGRRFLVSSTWNAPSAAFHAPDNPLFQGRSLSDILNSVTSVYRFCGYEILPEFAFFDVHKNPRTDEDLVRYAGHLAAVTG